MTTTLEDNEIYFSSPHPFKDYTHFCTIHQVFMDNIEYNGCNKGTCKECHFKLRNMK
jgi:hypothetical protein